jgi:hypothetical protein
MPLGGHRGKVQSADVGPISRKENCFRLKAIPCIDLFAGPGGLGEGFSSLADPLQENVFKVMLSIEKDPHAYQTLLLRSFFRQFQRGKVPVEYYDYLSGHLTRHELFSRYPIQASTAGRQAYPKFLRKLLPATLTRSSRQLIGSKSARQFIGSIFWESTKLEDRKRTPRCEQNLHCNSIPVYFSRRAADFQRDH